MFEREERWLREMGRDAADKAQAETTPDDALDTAIRSGIRQGRQRTKRRRQGLFALAGACALVLIMMGWSWESLVPQRAQSIEGPYPPLTGFDFGEDVTLNAANTHGLIQPVHQTVSEGDYTAGINGVLVGSQQLVIFYTLENHSGQPMKLLRTDIERTGSDIPLESFSVMSPYAEPDQSVHRSWLDIRLENASQLADEITVSFAVAPYSTNIAHATEAENEIRLDVDISLDLGISSQFTTVTPLNQMLEIEGQRYDVEQAILSPAGIVVKATVPNSNTMKVTGLVEPYVESVIDGEAVRLASRGAFLPGEDGQMTYFFDSNILDQPESLTLKAGGLLAVDPSTMQVVVDTEKGEVIHSPDGGMQFGSYEDHVLVLEYREEDERLFGSVSFEPEFVDGEGRRHTPREEAGSRTTSSMDAGAKIIRQYIYLKPQAYPQPLTFELSSYPGAIEKAIEIPLQ